MKFTKNANEILDLDLRVIIMGKTRILRGIIEGSSMKELFHYQGKDLKHGWRIRWMEVLHATNPGVSTSHGVVLHTNEVRQGRLNIEDNQTIAMGWYDGAGAGLQMLMDPDHTIVTTLYASNVSEDDAIYMVGLEKIKITETENIIYQIKEEAQGLP